MSSTPSGTPSGTAPDVPGVVVGWRAWQVDDTGRLRSPVKVSTEWPPGTELDARCELRGHPAPDPSCTCGLYAAREPSDVGGVGFGRVTLLGCLALWGTVVEGERGWRGAVGRPVVLFCGPALPEPVRAGLAGAHGVAVHRLHRPVAPSVERPGIGPAAARVRMVAGGAPPDADLLDGAARAFVDAVGCPELPAPASRVPRRVAVGTGLLAAIAASALLVPPADTGPAPAPVPPAATR